jgi:hypothetical protein
MNSHYYIFKEAINMFGMENQWNLLAYILLMNMKSTKESKKLSGKN